MRNLSTEKDIIKKKKSLNHNYKQVFLDNYLLCLDSQLLYYYNIFVWQDVDSFSSKISMSKQIFALFRIRQKTVNVTDYSKIILMLTERKRCGT